MSIAKRVNQYAYTHEQRQASFYMMLLAKGVPFTKQSLVLRW